jgi:hypothetical protein
VREIRRLERISTVQSLEFRVQLSLSSLPVLQDSVLK